MYVKLNENTELDLTYRDTLKPIFHCKLCLCWLSNASESKTNNMKSTQPTRKFCVGDPMPPIFYLFALGVGGRGNENFSLCIGGNANFSSFRYQHVGISNAKLWRLSQPEDPMGWFCVTVEYRLKLL